MKKFRIIGVVVLGGVILLNGCASPFVKTADEACGPFPNQNLKHLFNDLGEEGIDSLAIKALEAQPVDYNKCRSEYGDRHAAYVYGKALMSGETIAQDYKAAAKLFKFAGMPTNGMTPVYVAGFGSVSASTQMVKTGKATAGVTEAQYELGRMYLEGLGVGQSNRQARKWLKRAKNQGHEEAAELYAQLKNGEAG